MRTSTPRLLVLASFVTTLLCAPAPSAQGRAQRQEGFGPLPEWARESWFFRRQVTRPVAFVEANVIDVETGEVARGVHVVVRGDRIESVSYDEPPEDAELVDARDLWVIPGLFDLHAHVIPKSPFYPSALSAEETMAKLVEHGVTAIRCLPLTSEHAHEWRAEINLGRVVGPTMVVSSPVFEQRPQRTSFGFGDPETAAEWVRREALDGSRWIKVYNAMDPPSLRAIVETAHAFGMGVCGHTEEVPPLEASEIGMDCVEHMVSIPRSCKDDAELPPGLDLLERTAWLWEHYDEAQGHVLMDVFRRNRTAWVPTLAVTERLIEGKGHDGVSQTNEVVLASLRDALGKSAKLALHLHRAGGRVGLGTDFPVDGVVPGESAWRELELFVEYGGATPLEALQIGTRSSAEILGLQDLLGAVTPGRLAHFVFLRANPLEDVANVRDVAIVVFDGHVLERRELGGK